MESNAISAAAPSPDPAIRPNGRAAGASETPPAPPDLRPKPQSDPEFLASQAASEASPSARETFARFKVDPKTHDVSVEILDANSQEVIRTIPNEDLRHL